MGAVKIETLDHVALWVADRDKLADFLTRHVGMHVIDRTDKFTLVGSEARLGKLTLFAAEGPRERGLLRHVALRVEELEAALAGLPGDLPEEPRNGDSAFFSAHEGLGLGLVVCDGGGVDYDIDDVALTVADGERAFAELADLGFAAEDGRLRVGDSHVELQPGEPGGSERPLLNHLALKVASAEDHIEEAARRGLDVAEVVDAPNTYALFVWGPERIKLEYVEHKPGLSLV